MQLSCAAATALMHRVMRLSLGVASGLPHCEKQRQRRAALTMSMGILLAHQRETHDLTVVVALTTLDSAWTSVQR